MKKTIVYVKARIEIIHDGNILIMDEIKNVTLATEQPNTKINSFQVISVDDIIENNWM